MDEINKKSDEILDFCIRKNETKRELYNRIQNYFKRNVKERYEYFFDEKERIELNEDLVFYIVKELQSISLLKSSKDILSDAFEIYVSKILKDEGGQFFTPPNVVKFIVNYLNPDIDSNVKILDPACGHGGFLLEAKDLLWSKIEVKYQGQESLIKNRKAQIISNLYGIDKDLFLSKICKLYLEILSGGKANIFCENSLAPHTYRSQVQEVIKDNIFDYIFTNPPFGAKIPIDDKLILQYYKLGHSWKDSGENKWVMKKKLMKKQPPQILFIERCVQLLKNEGKMGIVLPEGIFGNTTDKYIWEFLEQNGKILGIISLDQNCFQPFTCNKTSILFFQKQKEVPDDYSIDFAIVDNIGHDKDGNISYKLKKDGSKELDSKRQPIVNDDLIDLHIKIRSTETFDYLKEQKIFRINYKQIKNKIYIPSYYTGVERTLQTLSKDKNYILMTFKDLSEKGVIYTNKNDYLPRGDEIGSHLYGLGNIPFIRTSEINNWEINLESNKRTSYEVYEQYKNKQNIEVGDILIVKDGGPNLIGKTAYITELDTEIIIQSHLYQIKVLENSEAIDPYLLLYLLNLDLVQKQIQAITFVQGTIATIGKRIMDVVVPIPSDLDKRKEISKYIRS
ncbi:MAG: N-6 DNA methylase, partial [Candidatus Hermodarchaeota archaeon]